MKDAILELASEAVFVRVFPLAVDDLEGDVFVRRTRGETQHGEVGRLGRRRHRVLERGKGKERIGEGKIRPVT